MALLARLIIPPRRERAIATLAVVVPPVGAHVDTAMRAEEVPAAGQGPLTFGARDGCGHGPLSFRRECCPADSADRRPDVNSNFPPLVPLLHPDPGGGPAGGVGERIAEEVDEGRLTIQAGRDALYWCYLRPEGPCPIAGDKGARVPIASTRTVHLSRTSPTCIFTSKHGRYITIRVRKEQDLQNRPK
jgi:hypothetical protein